MSDLFAKAFFLNGMKDALKVTVMNAKPTTLKAAIEKAMEAEQVIETANQVKNKISELAKMEDGDLEELEDLDEDTICQINKKRAQYG
jgi:Mg-chelatase subunit ChlD